MTKDEFKRIAMYLKSAYASPNFLTDSNAMLVWYSELNGYEYHAVAKAARFIVTTHKFPPSIAELIDAVGIAASPDELTPAEAWGAVLKAVRRYGYMREAKALASLPELVRRTTEQFGYRSVCECDEAELSVVRGQFERQYKQMRDKERKEEAMASIGIGAAGGQLDAVPGLEES